MYIIKNTISSRFYIKPYTKIKTGQIVSLNNDGTISPCNGQNRPFAICSFVHKPNEYYEAPSATVYMNTGEVFINLKMIKTPKMNLGDALAAGKQGTLTKPSTQFTHLIATIINDTKYIYDPQSEAMHIANHNQENNPKIDKFITISFNFMPHLLPIPTNA